MEFVNIINTDVVSSSYDQLWEDISPVIKDATVKQVLIIINNCEAESAEDQQLSKMLDACNLRPEQYNIVRLPAGGSIAWHQLRERLDPQVVFLIGVMPAQLGISAFFRLNEANNFNERIWLPTLDIAELEKHPDAKKQLWLNGMKPIFVDNPLPLASR
jgi:hypothetical protein